MNAGRWFKREVVTVDRSKRSKRKRKEERSTCKGCERAFSRSTEDKCPKCGLERFQGSVTIRVQCSGALHKVTFAPFGRTTFHNHDTDGMKALAAFKAAGDTTKSGCLECYEWLRGAHDPARRDVGAIVRQYRAVSLGREKLRLRRPEPPPRDKYLSALIAKRKYNAPSIDHRSLDPVVNASLVFAGANSEYSRALAELRKVREREWNFIKDVARYRNTIVEELRIEIVPIPSNGAGWLAAISNQFDYSRGEVSITTSRLTVTLPYAWASWARAGLFVIGFELVTNVIERSHDHAVIETVSIAKGVGDAFSSRSNRIVARRIEVARKEPTKMREMIGCKIPVDRWGVQRVLRTSTPVDFIDSSEHLRCWDSPIELPSSDVVKLFTQMRG